MPRQPFWEPLFADLSAPSPFGGPSDEIVRLAAELDGQSEVLDLGAGDGRHAVFLAQRGHQVTAVDISEAGVQKIRHAAELAGTSVNAGVCDLRSFAFAQSYDLIIAHGCLHLIERKHWNDLIGKMKEHTKPGGYNVIAVFTDALPPPADLESHMLGLFKEGELFELYRGWQLIETRSYVLEEEHPGSIRHQHPINKILARNPYRP